MHAQHQKFASFDDNHSLHPSMQKESNTILSWQLRVHVYAHANNQSSRNKMLQSFLLVYMAWVCVWVYMCISICVCIRLFCKRALWKRRCSAGIVCTCVYGGSVCMSICVYEYMCVYTSLLQKSSIKETMFGRSHFYLCIWRECVYEYMCVWVYVCMSVCDVLKVAAWVYIEIWGGYG